MKSYEMGFCFVVCNEATNLLSLRFQTNIFPIVVPAARSVPSVDQQVVVKISSSSKFVALIMSSFTSLPLSNTETILTESFVGMASSWRDFEAKFQETSKLN